MIDQSQDQMHLQGMDPLQGRKVFVRKRDGRIEEFNEARISLAIESAFKAVEGVRRDDKLPAAAQLLVKKSADAVLERVLAKAVRGEQLEVERIQDEVEDQLMLDGHLTVARRYILYREQRRQARADREGRLSGPTTAAPSPAKPLPAPESGKPPAAASISATPISATRAFLEKIYNQALPKARPGEDLESLHQRNFLLYVNDGQYLNLLPQEMSDFDLPRLAAALRLERDELFPLSGLQALHDEFLLDDGGRRFETPQYFWMRIAMGLALNEAGQQTARAIEFYETLSTFRFVPSESILAHAGTTQPQLLNCYSVTDWSDLEHVTAKNGPRLERRRKIGVTCSWLEPWHIGIWDFLQRPAPGEPPWQHDLNKALWVPDLFMKRVAENGHWTLFDPAEVTELHRKFGRAFETEYLIFEQKAERGDLRTFQRVDAVDLWREILASMAQTGQPWLGFKDAANVRSPQDNSGMVHNASLCTAILLNTTPAQPPACSVGAVNIGAHLSDAGSTLVLDSILLQSTVASAMRMLDNAIDISSFAIDSARLPGRENRPVALGILGFQDALDKLKIRYASAAAADFADRSMEMIAHAAIFTSTALARERGVYPNYEGSKWSHGLLPIDTLALLGPERGAPVDIDLTTNLDWSGVRAAVARHGMRNSTTTAISTTEAGSKITGSSLSIEPAAPKRASEVGPQWLVECAARRQKWLDMSQALCLYASGLDLTGLAEVYMQAWEKGLKTTRQLHLQAQPQPSPAQAASWSGQETPGQSRRDPVAVK